MTDSAAALKKLLAEIFHDQIVEPKERDALAQFTQRMSQGETLEVFRSFLHEKWGEVIADDIITGAERRLLGHILSELNLTLDHLPSQARMALKDVL